MKLEYIKDSKQFKVSEDNGEEILSVNYIFEDKEGDEYFKINNDNFTISLLYRKGVSENDSFIFFDKECSTNHNGRIGWCIPVISLTSREHDRADKSFWGYYAFACYSYILSNIDFIRKFTEGEYEDFNSAINSFYDENTVLFVADKTNCKNDFSIYNYNAFLSLYGFSENKQRIESESYLTINVEKGITLSKNADNSIFDDSLKKYSEKLCKGLIYDESPYIRFLKLYQLIEMLISKIMLNKFKIIMSKAEKGFASARDFESCLKNNSEIDRIKELCNKSEIILSQYDYIKELDNTCQTFLKNIGDEEDLTFPTSLYHFRNTMVHKFRFMESEEAIVSKVNDLFEMFLLRLMINIKTL